MNYETMSSDELEAHFNPRLAVPDFAAHIERYAEQSRLCRERLGGVREESYGHSPLQTLDILQAEGSNNPIHVFIHGGYWRALDKEQHSLVAEPLVKDGTTVVLINYDLCPGVSVDQIVAQCCRAIAWTARNAVSFGGDASRITLSGHSAGGQLALMALAEDWAGKHSLPADLIKATAVISGIFDLRPVLRISVNEDVRLDEEMAERNSPLLHPPTPDLVGNHPLLIAVGGLETEGWVGQSRDLAAACQRNGTAHRYIEAEDRDHFSILYELADHRSPLCQAWLEQVRIANQ